MLRKIRRRLRNWVIGGDSFSRSVVDLAYRVAFRFDQREHAIRPGSRNPGITFYVIRSTSDDEGLISLFHSAMRGVEYAVSKGYTPIVDYLNYPSQYSLVDKFGQRHNAWDIFFLQPSSYGLEEVYQSQRVILSGWRWRGNRNARNPSTLFYSGYNDDVNNARHAFIHAHSGLSEEVVRRVGEVRDQLFGLRTLGVFLRGTDYTALRPRGHAAQPEVLQVIGKTQQFIDRHGIDRVFLVTEDGRILRSFQEAFGPMLVYLAEDIVEDYISGEYISKCVHRAPAIERGMIYLVKLALLAECDYLVTSIANGSLFAMELKKGSFFDKHVFDLGLY